MSTHIARKRLRVGSALLAAALAVTLSACGGTTQAETVEVRAEVPEVCLGALDAADELVGLSGEAMLLIAPLFSTTVPNSVLAAATGDVAGLERATDELEAFTDDMTAISGQVASSDYMVLAEQCRTAEEAAK